MYLCAVFLQLAARAAAYPVPWSPTDLAVAWLNPSRLIAYVDVNRTIAAGVPIPATLNGTTVPVNPVWSCRSVQVRMCDVLLF